MSIDEKACTIGYIAFGILALAELRSRRAKAGA
jgi:hypothetical protein